MPRFDNDRLIVSDRVLVTKSNPSPVTPHKETHAAGGSDAITPASIGAAAAAHTHVVANITDLQNLLNGKADSIHVHSIANVTGLQTALDAKAPTVHTHTTSDVTGLQTLLDGKAASVHTHSISDVTGLQTSLDGKAATTHSHSITDVTNLQSTLSGKAASVHTHSVSDVTGLQTALDDKVANSTYSSGLAGKQDVSQKNQSGGYAGLDSSGLIATSAIPALSVIDVFPVASEAAQLALTAQRGDLAVRTDLSRTYIRNNSNTGTMSDWTWLATPVDAVLSVNGQTGAVNLTYTDVGAAASSHTHGITDVTNLQTTLNGKAALIHTHEIADTNGLQTALNGKAAASHTHIIANVTGLQTALDGKAASVHTHAIGDVTNLQTTLDGKAASVHSHTIGDLPVASSGSSSSTQVVRADDSRLSDARTPTAHAASHEFGGTDFVDLSDLNEYYSQRRAVRGTSSVPGLSTVPMMLATGTVSQNISAGTATPTGDMRGGLIYAPVSASYSHVRTVLSTAFPADVVDARIGVWNASTGALVGQTNNLIDSGGSVATGAGGAAFLDLSRFVKGPNGVINTLGQIPVQATTNGTTLTISAVSSAVPTSSCSAAILWGMLANGASITGPGLNTSTATTISSVGTQPSAYPFSITMSQAASTNQSTTAWFWFSAAASGGLGGGAASPASDPRTYMFYQSGTNYARVGSQISGTGITGTVTCSTGGTQISSMTYSSAPVYRMGLSTSTTGPVVGSFLLGVYTLALRPNVALDTKYLMTTNYRFDGTSASGGGSPFSSPVALTAGNWYILGMWAGGSASATTYAITGTAMPATTYSIITPALSPGVGPLTRSIAATALTGGVLPSLTASVTSSMPWIELSV